MNARSTRHARSLPRPAHTRPVWALTVALLLCAPSHAAAANADEPWEFSGVLDAGATSRQRLLGTRDGGLQLGHSDLMAHGPVGRHLHARVSASVATDAGRLERAVEEAWLETRRLPAGLSLRAGRLRSQVSVLNEQHPHADDFSDRPLLHRAFFGSHWYDDGLRLNLKLPTALSWTVGAEMLRGRQLVPSAEALTPGASITTLMTRLTGEIADEHFWRLGVSRMLNRRAPGVTTEALHDEAAHAEESHGSTHRHGARYGGRQMWLVDAAWAWDPDGDSEDPRLRTTLEVARITGLGALATPGASHGAVALATVWRFAPQWEVGARLSTLRVAQPAGDTPARARLNEPSVMVAWKPGHPHTLRLQWSRQSANASPEFASPVRRALTLQYLYAFGAHDGHSH